MKNLLIVFIFFLGGFVHSQEIDSLRIKQIEKEIDSIKYTKIDFKQFKKSISDCNMLSDSKGNKTVIERNTELDLMELLTYSFEDAKVKYGEKNIKMMIYSYYKSKEVLKKFRKLDSAFNTVNDSLELKNKLSSDKYQMSDSLKKEIEKYKKQLDSLKKN